MNKIQAQFTATMVILAALALYMAVDATHRGETLTAFTMLVIATIFWSRVQKKRN